MLETVKISRVEKVDGGYVLIAIDVDDMLFGNTKHPLRYKVSIPENQIPILHNVALTTSYKSLEGKKAFLDTVNGTLSFMRDISCKIDAIQD